MVLGMMNCSDLFVLCCNWLGWMVMLMFGVLFELGSLVFEV